MSSPAPQAKAPARLGEVLIIGEQQRLAPAHDKIVTGRIASNIAKLPALLGATDQSEIDFQEGGG
jgi:hypothetical protein